jgi:hypothetical protein
MGRDSKLGYGFLFMGVAMPYLIEHFLGATVALVATVLCALIGVMFLLSGHTHRDAAEPPITLFRKIVTSILAVAVIVAICLVGWKVHKDQKGAAEVTHEPSSIPPIIIQNGKEDTCSNIVAGKEVKVDCPTVEKDNEKAKSPKP